MIKKHIFGVNLPDAYHYALRTLCFFGIKSPCEWQNQTAEMKEISLTMTVLKPLTEPMLSRLWIGGPFDLERYVQEILDGRLDCMIGNGWDYTYHDRMVNFSGKDQIQYVIDELRRCPYSRRAVISIRTADDIGSNDPACLQHIQFMIRDDVLNMKVLFRSNDACKATFMNAFALIMLQKRVADELGVPVGTYEHTANSFHCYDKDYDLLKAYVHRISEGNNLTYNYEGEFKALMDEAKPDVDALFKELKSKI